MGCSGSKELSPRGPAGDSPRSPGTIARRLRTLLQAAEAGDESGAAGAIGEGAEIEGTDPAGYTALMLAAAGGKLGVARRLLRLGAAPGAVNEEGDGPLHLAAANGHPRLVEALIEAGADRDAANRAGQLPLDLARDPESRELLQERPSAKSHGPAFELPLTQVAAHEAPEPEPEPVSRLDQRRRKYKARVQGSEPAVLWSVDPPSELLCGLGNKLMADPVRAADGQLYDRPAIRKWFERRNVSSPVTRERLSSQHLEPDSQTKAAVWSWLHQASARASRRIPWDELEPGEPLAPSRCGELGAFKQCWAGLWGGVPVVLVGPAPSAPQLQEVIPLEQLCQLSQAEGLIDIFGVTQQPQAGRCFVCERAPLGDLGSLLERTRKEGASPGLRTRLALSGALVQAVRAAGAVGPVCLHNVLVLRLDEQAAAMDLDQTIKLGLTDFGWRSAAVPEPGKPVVSSARGNDTEPSASRLATVRRRRGPCSARVSTPRAVQGTTQLRWQPPEGLQGGWEHPRSLVWSTAVALWQIWADGRRPYHELREEAVPLKLSRGERLRRPRGCPVAVYKLLERCWAAGERPGLEELASGLGGLDPVVLGLEEQWDSSESDESDEGEPPEQMTLMASPQELEL